MLRRSRSLTADSVLVRVRRNEVQLSLPVWMLDAELCQGLVEEAHPRLSVSALTELRRLLDGQPFLASRPQEVHEKAHIPKRRR